MRERVTEPGEPEVGDRFHRRRHARCALPRRDQCLHASAWRLDDEYFQLKRVTSILNDIECGILAQGVPLRTPVQLGLPRVL